MSEEERGEILKKRVRDKKIIARGSGKASAAMNDAARGYVNAGQNCVPWDEGSVNLKSYARFLCL